MKGLQKISLPTTKTALIGVSILALIIVAIGTILISNNEIKAQETQIALLQQTLQKNNSQIDTLTKNNASQSAQIKALLTQPTPTPVIETQYDSQPSTQNNTQAVVPTPTLPLGETIAKNVLKNAFEHIENPGSTITNCSWTGSGMSCTSN